MKIEYRKIRLSKENKQRLELINSIIEDYQADGYVLTLRQLYYQLVSRDIIPNKDSEYKKVGKLIAEGRMAGIVDWSAIEDRNRRPTIPASWDSPEEIVDTVVSQFAQNRQLGQLKHIEVWVEKDALSGVLERVTRPYHVPLVVNKGYSSVSAMHEAWKRFKFDMKPVDILYCGDHDPSGIDMIRDVEDRIREFMDASGFRHNFSVTPIALTMDQIREYNPPPNPAKKTDSRFEVYQEAHGNESWEVDALPPRVLNDLVDNAIKQRMDMEIYQICLDEEEKNRRKLRWLRNKLKDVTEEYLADLPAKADNEDEDEDDEFDY